MFNNETVRAVEEIARRLDVKPAWLLAVAEVESAGKAFADVNGRQEPMIRWEGHYFDRRLINGKRDLARHQGLASPKAGGVPNPKSQAKRWAIVERARKIDRQAASESFSIGVGQVMTAHWKKLGFKSVDELIARARESAAGQIDVMARYIEHFGLVDELQRGDATAFARGYNGPNFRAGGYHTKIAAAYRRISGDMPQSDAMGMLRMGSKGARVRELQALLLRAGYSVKVDGDYGPATRDAVKEEQKKARMKVDGIAGPATLRWLERYKVAPDEQPGAEGPLSTDEGKAGAGTVVGGGGVVVAADKINEIADKVPGGAEGVLSYAVSGLYVIAGLLVVGGLAYAAWGWWKSRHTDEGDVVLG